MCDLLCFFMFHAQVWAIIVCGTATAFTGGLLAFSGPVQAGSGDKVTVRPDPTKVQP